MVKTLCALVHIIGASVRRTRLTIVASPKAFGITVLVVEVGTVLSLVLVRILGERCPAIFITVLFLTIVVHHILINRNETRFLKF
jgi:hypothetical protein